MKKFLPLLVLVSAMFVGLGAKCPSTPSPQPTPTPSPTPISGTSLLLHRSGKVFMTEEEKPFDLKVRTSCCFTEDPEVDPGWALASHGFIDSVASTGFNWIHVRLGPYRIQPDWGDEQKRAGSPYVEVNGKADLTQFALPFFTYVEDFVVYGASKKVGFEIDLMDGWGIKWQKARPNQFPQGHPWVASSNVQNQDWINPAGTRAIIQGDVWYAWIEHIVQVAGKYDNVFYQVGNEDSQIKGITPEWEISACNAVHASEVKYGYKRHLCGSNSPDLVANRAEIDFLTTHEGLPLLQSQCFDTTRPCRNNEMNNPLTGQQWFQFYCASKANGTYLDFWRAEMPLVEATKAWDLLKGGCANAPPPGCSHIPDEDSLQVLPKPPADPAIVNAVNAALKHLHPECEVGSNCPINKPLQAFLQDFAEEVRQGPEKLCAGIQNTPEGPVDEVCVGSENLCQGQHVFACKTGCTSGTVSWAPGSYNRASDTWKRP